MQSHHGDSCATMVTPSFLPYIDLITQTFGVAIGGNGKAGKSSDEIGRLAADMIVKSKWNGDISMEVFKINAKDSKL
ncbi:hypothetical protein KUTeg_020007 [Tegillarca granosa]|uniref:Uncharacterized protein n=1 Tax=Tegillarca granosa TaxID=220873 RepID=A0ABQ9EIC0_TEGGR|nr:hypothetical protein KUTeg_020007 [Tegillarca granosa]